MSNIIFLRKPVEISLGADSVDNRAPFPYLILVDFNCGSLTDRDRDFRGVWAIFSRSSRFDFEIRLFIFFDVGRSNIPEAKV